MYRLAPTASFVVLLVAGVVGGVLAYLALMDHNYDRAAGVVLATVGAWAFANEAIVKALIWAGDTETERTS